MLTPILIVVETIISSLIIISVSEYLFTEVFYVFRYLKTTTKTEIFLITLVVLFAVNYFSPKIRSIGKKVLPGLVVLLFFSLLGYKKYRNYYGNLQNEPKIFSISSKWSIQAKRIIIEGKNFGWAHDQSRVVCDDERFLVDSWNPNRIVVSAPLTGNFGTHDLFIHLHNGEESRKIPFEFKDPIELSWKK